MTDGDSFLLICSGLEQGDGDAARAVFVRFARRLLALARGQFDSWLGDRPDPEGIVQSAYKSFFIRHQSEPFALASWNDLWALLTVITLRKCRDRRDYLLAARRDLRRERPLADGPGNPLSVPDRDPTPAEAAALAETVERLFAALRPRERNILELCLQGCPDDEIAAQLGCSERTVRRVRLLVRRMLEQWGVEESTLS